VLGDQIYIAALIELAGTTQVGKTWAMDRDKISRDLGISDAMFDDVQQQIEARMPGKWDKASSSNRQFYVYMRLK
jgi:hypothetical protein